MSEYENIEPIDEEQDGPTVIDDFDEPKKKVKKEKKAKAEKKKTEEKPKKNQLTKEQVKERIYKKKVKRAFRIARFRFIKNFLLWFSGVLSSVAIVAGAIFVGVKVVPVSTYFGKDVENYVSTNVASKSLLDAVLSISEYSFSDLPIIEKTLDDLIKSTGIDGYITIDYDKLNQVKFAYQNGETNMMNELQKCLIVSATIESSVGIDVLGDIGKISCFKDFEPVPNDELPNESDKSSFNPKLYYYMATVNSGTSPMAEGSSTYEYKRAFDDEGNRVPDAVGKQLFFGALAKVPILDALDLLTESFERLKIIDLLEIAGASSGEEDGLVEKIFSGKKIKDLDEISADDIGLFDVLGGEEDGVIYEMLKSATGANSAKDITLGDLTDENFNVDNITLNSVLENTEGNEELYNLIVDAVVVGEGEERPTAETVTIGHLKNIDTDNIALSTVLPEPEPGKDDINDILLDAVTATGDDGEGNPVILVGDLATLDMNNIKLATVMDSDNDTLKNLLTESCGADSFDDITMGDLGTFKVDNIKLSTAMPNAQIKLKQVIVEALNMPYDINLSSEEEGSLDKVYGQVKIIQLSSSDFNFDNVSLSSVMDSANDTLKSVLSEACGSKPFKDIKVGDMSDFDIGEVSLSTVLKKEQVNGNHILETLLDEPNVKIKNIGEKINNLELYEIFGKYCFTTDSSKAVNTTDKYVMTEDDGVTTFTLSTSANPDAIYYRHKDEGLWLILCFTATTDSSTGKATAYTEDKTATMVNLQNGDSEITHKFEHSTIRQLVDANIVESPTASGGADWHSEVYKWTIPEVLTELSELLSLS